MLSIERITINNVAKGDDWDMEAFQSRMREPAGITIPRTSIKRVHTKEMINLTVINNTGVFF